MEILFEYTIRHAPINHGACQVLALSDDTPIGRS